MKKYPSIFNDVLSPITPGPSSSNTCGPYRILKICRQILGEQPCSMIINMAQQGGYKDTFFSMQSDLACISGILNKDFLTYDLNQAYEDACKEDLHFNFNFVDYLPLQPSELMEISLKGPTRFLKVIGVSLGGGEIEITQINGVDTCITGKKSIDTGIVLEKGRSYTAKVTPVFPFGQIDMPKVPFHSANELFHSAAKSQIPLWKLAFEYESSITGASYQTLRDYANRIYHLAIESAKKGESDSVSFNGVTSPKAKQYKQALHENRLLPLGIANQGCLTALSIMEYSNAHGKIVCMPTGGSSGVIPAVIEESAKSLNCSIDNRINALMTAGLVGTFFYPTHYTGALGCQAEIGIAISMAAAAAAALLSSDPMVIEAAASFGGQSVMGLVCNPINGYVQVPCILRNMTAVPTAITCANAALAGLDAIVPLDDIVSMTLEVGKMLRPCNIAGTYNIPNL